MQTVFPPQPWLLLPVPSQGSDGRQRDEQVHDSGHPAQALRTVRPGGGQVSFNFFLIYMLKATKKTIFKRVKGLGKTFSYTTISVYPLHGVTKRCLYLG
jgi:hypothetical protein